MANLDKWVAGSLAGGAALITTGLNTLANNTYTAVGTEYDNSSGLYRWGMAELVFTFGTNPTAGTSLDLFLVTAVDGTNYEDGGGSVKPGAGSQVGSFECRAVTTVQRRFCFPFLLPPTKFKPIVYNNGTGQSTSTSPSTAHSLKIYLLDTNNNG